MSAMKISRLTLLSAIVLLAVLVSAIVVVTSAFAAPPTPPPQGESKDGQGYGMMGVMGGLNINGVAKLVGVSKSDVISQLKQGKTLKEIAQGKATEEQLVNTLVAPYKDELAVRVKYEFITQSQADASLQKLSERVKAAVNTSLNGDSETDSCGGSGGMMGDSGSSMHGSSGMMGGSGGMMNGSGGTTGGNGRINQSAF